MKKQPAPRKHSAAYQRAQWALDSACIRGAPEEEIEKLRAKRDALYFDTGEVAKLGPISDAIKKFR